jgi:hypothetical protein
MASITSTQPDGAVFHIENGSPISHTLVVEIKEPMRTSPEWYMRKSGDVAGLSKTGTYYLMKRK